AAAGAQRLSHELLVRSPAVDVGRVEEVDARIERRGDGGERFGLVRRAVELAHAHAAETHHGKGEAFSSELALFHRGGVCPSEGRDARATLTKMAVVLGKSAFAVGSPEEMCSLSSP